MEDEGARARAINDEAATLFAAGRLAEARDGFERAVALVPGYAEAWQNLAVVRLRLGLPEAALDAMRRALEAAPRDATLWHELAQLLRRLGKPVDAAEALARAGALAPTDPSIAEDRGRLALSLKRPAEALKHVDALGRRPGALSVRARAATALGDREEALRTWHALFDLAPCHTGAAAGLLAALLYEGGDPREVPRVAQAWASACGRPPPPAPQTARDPRRILRVGYVSPDFRRHSVGWFALPAIAAHDKRAVEIFLYPTRIWDDDMSAQFRAVAGPRWRSIAGLEADAAAAAIRADAIDLLVDLAGHTEGGRLDIFMRKPAPLQLTWLGWPATTGLAAIDGRLTDAIADPPDADPASVEAPLRLSDGFHVWRPPAGVADLPPATVPPGATVFASFNNARKVGAASVALWARVLAAVPDAILWLKSEALADPAFARRLAAAFAATGVAASRLRLEGARPPQRPHFAAYGAMHVALDPAPYNGTTTTIEALWMGVPVIALGGGDRHAARVGASLLTHAGMPELVARDAEDYVARAVAFARDRDRLGHLRAELRGRLLASPLMDEAGFARRLEAVYRELWQRYCEGLR